MRLYQHFIWMSRQRNPKKCPPAALTQTGIFYFCSFLPGQLSISRNSRPKARIVANSTFCSSLEPVIYKSVISWISRCCCSVAG